MDDPGEHEPRGEAADGPPRPPGARGPVDGRHPDPAFADLPRPVVVTSLFVDHPDREQPAHDGRPRAAPPRPGHLAATRPRPGTGHERADGPDRRTAADTSPGGEHAPPRAVTVAPWWPSAGPPKAGQPLVPHRRPRSTRRRRTARRGSVLPWLALPVGLAVLALLLVATHPDTTDTASRQAGDAPGPGGGAADATPRPTTVPRRPDGSGAVPATPPATMPGAAGASVALAIDIEDRNGTGRTARVAAVVDGRVLVPPARSHALPLHLEARTSPGAALTLVVAQPPAGSRLVCVVSATGGVVGSMTRAAEDGVLDCSTAVADLVSGGT